MALQTTPGLNTAASIAIGFFRVNARYTVRGRRAQLLSPAIRLSLMTAKEREEMAKILLRDYGRGDVKDVAFQRFKSL
jgi:hypothetical protein